MRKSSINTLDFQVTGLISRGYIPCILVPAYHAIPLVPDLLHPLLGDPPGQKRPD